MNKPEWTQQRHDHLIASLNDFDYVASADVMIELCHIHELLDAAYTANQFAAPALAAPAETRPQQDWSPLDPDPWVERCKLERAIEQHWKRQMQGRLIEGRDHTNSFALCRHPDCVAMRSPVSKRDIHAGGEDGIREDARSTQGGSEAASTNAASVPVREVVSREQHRESQEGVRGVEGASVGPAETRQAVRPVGCPQTCYGGVPEELWANVTRAFFAGLGAAETRQPPCAICAKLDTISIPLCREHSKLIILSTSALPTPPRPDRTAVIAARLRESADYADGITAYWSTSDVENAREAAEIIERLRAASVPPETKKGEK